MYVDNYNAREKVTQWTGQASTACLCGRTIFKWEKDNPKKLHCGETQAYCLFLIGVVPKKEQSRLNTTHFRYAARCRQRQVLSRNRRTAWTRWLKILFFFFSLFLFFLSPFFLFQGSTADRARLRCFSTVRSGACTFSEHVRMHLIIRKLVFLTTTCQCKRPTFVHLSRWCQDVRSACHQSFEDVPQHRKLQAGRESSKKKR